MPNTEMPGHADDPVTLAVVEQRIALLQEELASLRKIGIRLLAATGGAGWESRRWLTDGGATDEQADKLIADYVRERREAQTAGASRREASRVGDLIGLNADGIPDDVLELVDALGDTWHRVFGDDRYPDDDGVTDRSQPYDWRAEGGWSTSEGHLAYAPLRVTRVTHP